MSKEILSPNSSNEGVIYSPNDHAGFWLRSLVILIDSVFLIFFSVVLSIIFSLFSLPNNYLSIIIFLIVFIYLTIIKSSTFGTVAYAVLQLKIVELTGSSPSFFKMIIRFALLFISPLSLVFDTIWLTGETTKQTFRDKIVGTYVVKRNSIPIEFGLIRFVHLDITAGAFTIKEVQKSETHSILSE